MKLVVIKKIPEQKELSLPPALSPAALNVVFPKSLGGGFSKWSQILYDTCRFQQDMDMSSKLFVITKFN